MDQEVDLPFLSLFSQFLPVGSEFAGPLILLLSKWIQSYRDPYGLCWLPFFFLFLQDFD